MFFTRYIGKLQDTGSFVLKIRRGSNEPHLVGSFYNGIFTPPFGGGNAHDLLKNSSAKKKRDRSISRSAIYR